MTDSAALVSVITVVHNYGRYIDEALNSVRGQFYRPIEVIVVDDGSTDDSADRAASHPEVTLLRLSNRGVAAARNSGLQRARGEFVTFLDADDVMGESALSDSVPHLEENPGLAVVFPRQTVRLEPGVPMPGWMRPDPLMGELGGVPLQAGLYRKSVFDELGWFTDGLRTGEFFDLMARLPDPAGRVGFVDVVGVERRIHGDNLTYRVDDLQRNLFRSLRERVERGRS